MQMNAPIKRAALFNRQGNHRKTLTRSWALPGAAERWLTFVMLNPSTASGTEDDPTIRRCVAFAAREGFTGIIVVNLFTFRSTEPNVLLGRPHKSLNTYDADMHISQAALASEKVVAAWGAGCMPVLSWRAIEVLAVLKETKRNVWCFGKTKEGHPKHPLYLSKGERLVPLQFATPELIISNQEQQA